MRRTAMIMISLVMLLLAVSSCAPSVSQQEYDRVSSELSAVKTELASIQTELEKCQAAQAGNEDLGQRCDALKTEFDAVQAEYSALINQYEAIKDEYGTLQASYEELSKEYDVTKAEFEAVQADYEELSSNYNILMEGKADFSEEDVEQAVFQLVNQERSSRGLNELEWGTNLYKWAQANSRNMATNQRLEYSDYGAFQNLYWAVGYISADRMARAVFTAWQNMTQYERHFLNVGTKYGVVAAYKPGEIFYITYIADYFE
ncbi:CAP domain-containing protein [Chloroflexota bacterium]